MEGIRGLGGGAGLGGHMRVTFSRTVLSDRKPAMQVDRLPDSPIYMHVWLVSRQALRGDSGGYEIALKAEY